MCFLELSLGSCTPLPYGATAHLRGVSVRRCPLLGEPMCGLLAVDASLRLSAADLESLLPKVIGC
jgi:hypothetical protein